MHERRVPYQLWFFRAPYQLMKRFSRRKLSKTLRKKQPGSLSAIRVPQKEQPFGIISSVLQKEGLSKVCQKFEKIYATHSAERTTSSPYDAKKLCSAERKLFSFFFQNLDEKTASEPHGQIVQTLENLRKNDPNLASHTHTRQEWRKMTLASTIFLSTFFCVFVCLAPLYFLVFVSFVVFDVVFFL